MGLIKQLCGLRSLVHRSILRVLTAIQLTRLTMAFGAVSDVWLVILITRAGDNPDRGVAVYDMPLGLALFAGAVVALGLFAYGASLNDVLDARHDSAFSPDRPIPAGRIRVGQAIVVTVGALLVAILGGHALGSTALRLTLLTAVGILFYNAAGRFIPAVGLVSLGLIHATHMMIPNLWLEFTWPVWWVMSHAMCVGIGAHILERKRPRLTRRALWVVVCGWGFWTAVILGWGFRTGLWPEDVSPRGVLWPILALVAFVAVARWKITGVNGPIAAEKLLRYGAMWQSLYGAMWLFALDLTTQGIWIALFAITGFSAMTLIKEMMGQVNRPLTYRA